MARYRFAEFNPQATYPAEVLRVIDGDTFEARVRIWSGFEIDTRVRLRAIDAPELHARCASEYLKAEAARAALQRILSAGGVTVSQVGPDKYRGRIDAAVATRDTPDVSAALLKGGWPAPALVLTCHSGSPSISGVPEIDTFKSKSATANLVGGKSGIHIR